MVLPRLDSELEPQEAATVAHHKRRRPKHRRAGCLLCKPSKLTANKKADRARERRQWSKRERDAW
jgi:hypothetical protein